MDPLEYNPLGEGLRERLDAFFGRRDHFIEVNPGHVVMPKAFADLGDSIRALPIRPNDVWLMSFPRAGSTWAQEMVWLLGNNLDYDAARNQLQQVRTPLLELSAIFSDDRSVEDTVTRHEKIDSVQCVQQMVGRRFIKSHLPWQLHPREMDNVRPKIIYVVRNPKDLCVSYYYYCQLIHRSEGTFEEFCDLFLADQAPIGPMWAHALAFWKRRNQDNMLFLKYEDMKRNLPEVIRQCAEFLEFGRELTEEEVQRMCDHLQFERMQRNPAVNLEPLMKESQIIQNNAGGKFIRKGEIGDWKNHMDAALSARFDAWIEEHFEGTGLEFDYE
ncbi:luciferin sulfotransferase [Anopheles maculipalpis]|uniref:luciferin sulfotransferase n=1 Tax=Anopheles maculipalpis TaxID=1496333 RepID=UPI00215985AB|nr:luciferin sulfotransferase [Anopheles maculipalpis]